MVAPSSLTKEQFDIVNLNGETPTVNNDRYVLEQDPAPKKIEAKAVPTITVVSVPEPSL
jgi:hypothetical protein